MANTFYSNCSPITVGCTLYSGSNCTGPVSNGYYSTGGSNCTTYEVTGSGIVSSIYNCSYTLTIRAKTNSNVTEPIQLYYNVNNVPVNSPYDSVALGSPSGSFVTSTSAGNVSDTTCFEYGTISGLIPGDDVYIVCYNTVTGDIQRYGYSTSTCPGNGGTLCGGSPVATIGSTNTTIYITISTDPGDPNPLQPYIC